MIKTNIKMRVTPEQSKQVQEICFANGIGWSGVCFTPTLLNKEYLMIRNEITWDKGRYFDKDLEEVDASLFIRTQGTCVEDLLSKTYKELEEETHEQELKQNTNKEETMEKNEVENYADVKEYLIAKGLYERVLDIDWEIYEEDTFSDLFIWSRTKEGHYFWNIINYELFELEIQDKIESLVQDYKAKQGKEVIKHIEAKPTEQKPKQYLCYVQGKALPKHIHKTLEQAKQEAQRLCRKELAKVSVLEVMAEYEAEVLVKEVL